MRFGTLWRSTLVVAIVLIVFSVRWDQVGAPLAQVEGVPTGICSTWDESCQCYVQLPCELGETSDEVYVEDYGSGGGGCATSSDSYPGASSSGGDGAGNPPPNVIESDGSWHPAPGYCWANDAEGDYSVLPVGSAVPGLSNVLFHESCDYIPVAGYVWATPDDPSASGYAVTLPHVQVLANGNYQPEPGYCWANQVEGDYSVVPVGSAVPGLSNVLFHESCDYVPVAGYVWVTPDDPAASGYAVTLPHVQVLANGDYQPEPGYCWASQIESDYSVVPVGSAVPGLSNVLFHESCDYIPVAGYVWVTPDDPAASSYAVIAMSRPGDPVPGLENVIFGQDGAYQPASGYHWASDPPSAANYAVLPDYEFYGNGFIGGTGWIAGYNRPSDADPELIAKINQIFRTNTELAGANYGQAIDFERYNFVLGIGQTSTVFQDLRTRVIFDQFSNGQFTAAMQEGYNSLKGKDFDELACHSNGAMICLAALENRDLTADRVVLYGPQLSIESVQMWQALIDSGRVQAVEIYLNQNDPVPPFSMLLGSRDAVTALGNLGLFRVDVLQSTIAEAGPDIGVRTFSCGGLVPTLDCHDMRVYKINRGCERTSSGEIVPGTTLPGGRGVLEPPPPC